MSENVDLLSASSFSMNSVGPISIFWKNNHPLYPDFSLGSLPPLVRRIYFVGQGFCKPKDVIPSPSGGNIEPTIVPEIARLCAGKNDWLAQQLAKVAKCASKKSLAGFMSCPLQLAASSSSSSSSSSTSVPNPQAKPKPKPKPKLAPTPIDTEEGEEPITEKEMHSHLDNQILNCLMCVYNNMAHPQQPDPKDVRWWINRCPAKRSNEPRETYTQLRKQVNLIGVDCVTAEEAEEFYMKYGVEGLLSCEDLFQYLYFLRQSRSWDNCAYQSRSDCSDDLYMRNVSPVQTLVNSVVDEIWWEERLSPYNHNPHFPYFVAHFTNNMPMCSDVLFNPKYAGHVYKITVAVDNLGNIVWICDLMPGASTDVMIWDEHGPSRTHGQLFDFEIGAYDGAYKGRLHSAIPYIGRKTLSEDQQECNNVHGCYRARVGHLFAWLWQWMIVRNVWTRSATELHGHVRILPHLTQLCYLWAD